MKDNNPTLPKDKLEQLDKNIKDLLSKGASQQDVVNYTNDFKKKFSTPTPTTEKKKPVQKGGASVGANTSSVLPKQTNKQPNFKDDLKQPHPFKNEVIGIDGSIQQLPQPKKKSED